MKLYEYGEILGFIKAIIKNTKWEGHVFSVGGCERDKNLGVDIKDIDLVVDVPNGGIEFANWLYKKNYLKGSPVTYEHYGTAMFVLSEFPHLELEAVQTRKESYRDMESRNPDTAYGTIMEDCMRRDFTMNSLYHNISTSEDLDLTGRGIEDLKNGIIRTCDDPNIIFKEDPLRIMRAIRFSCKYRARMTPETKKGIVDNVSRLSIISRERITDEFNKIITINPVMGLDLLRVSGILSFLYGVDSSINYCCGHTEGMDLPSLLAYFFKASNVGIDRMEKIMREFKYSNDIINDTKFYCKAVNRLNAINNCTDAEIRELQYFCKSFNTFLNVVCVAEKIGNTIAKTIIEGISTNLTLNGLDLFGYELPVNGNDVMEILNIPPSKEVKESLNALLEKAYELGPKVVNREYCINYLKTIKNGK